MQRESPYKFLNYYEFDKENPEPFFGRQRETQILLSDILVSRLVVLFAQTGTGKTSLINAGVRPLLEKRDYDHVLIRVRDDAAESARAELTDYLQVGSLKGKTLVDQILWAKKQVKHPLVLFFDQFEEFFLQRPTRKNKQNASRFVSDIAALYENSGSGIHIVFSMREEWFVKMDLFREHIPELFQNESSLRLRFFQSQQAREAIVGPAGLRGVEMDEALIKKVISDLANDDGEIEPAQLQIICDTLWQNKGKDALITIDDYRNLGLKYAPSRKRHYTKISQHVLTGRLVEAFEKLDREPELKVLSRLLPELCTDENTKSFRDLDGLAQGLQVQKDDLRPLINYLESCRLVRTLDRGDVTFVELAHDYLAHRQRLNDLRERIEAVWPRKLLDKARSAEQSYKAARTGVSREEVLKALADKREDCMSPENLQTISDNVATAEYDADDLEFLFRWALSRGVEAQVELWFHEARKEGVAVWEILEQIIDDTEASWEEAEKAVRLLGRLRDKKIWDLLSMAFKREDLASVAIEVLSDTPASESARMLESALKDENLREEAIAGLGRMRTTVAVDVLRDYLEAHESDELTLRVLERISKGREDKVALRAKRVLQKRGETTQGDAPLTTTVAHFEPDLGTTKSYEGSFPERDFEMLADRIARGRCTPILGAGVTHGLLPFGSQIAHEWANQYDYPFDDQSDLSKVAQYLAVNYDAAFPKELILKRFREFSPSQTDDPDHPINVFARLPFPLYVATNYDDLFVHSLKAYGKKPLQEYCRWNRGLVETRSKMDLENRPTLESPLVYHLYGVSSKPESLVLSEEDYLSHLVNVSRDERIIPPIIQQALSSSSILFLGFNVSDWNFLVLMSSLVPYLEQSLARAHFCVQSVPIPNEASAVRVEKIQEYFGRYFAAINIKIYWGAIRDFAVELRKHWQRHEHAG